MENIEIQEENNFLHIDMVGQIQMARELKASVNWQHKPVKKTKRRLFEIMNPRITSHNR